METISVKRLPHQRFALGEFNAWMKKDVAQNQIQDLSEIIPNGEMCNSCISFVFFNAHAVIYRKACKRHCFQSSWNFLFYPICDKHCFGNGN
ncbi:hypothetical protein T07_7401 [Trichinella nelsoni]|uniref:Uncharacterized protein n=1 Tax=Trichinella nelsoni TaxID=6336 RepID=A0A0V0S6I7_9BILA|nr:hypothetical protein T07_7401 [Trichinella nelsoni]